MRTVLLVLFLSVCSCYGYTQSGEYGRKIEQIKIGAQNARFSNTQDAIELLREGLKLSTQYNNEIDIGYFYRKLISEKGNDQQLDSALYYFHKGVSYYWKVRQEKGEKHMDDVLLLAHLQSELAEAYSANFQLNKSRKTYEKAMDLYASNDDYVGVGITKINLANISLKESDFPKAIELFLESKAVFDTTSYHYIIAEVFNGISTAYEKMENYNQAINYADKYLASIRKDPYEYAGVVNAQIYLARLHSKLGNLLKMQLYLSEATKGIDSLRLNYFKPAIASVRSMHLMTLGKFQSAKQILLSAEEYVDESNVDPMQEFEYKRILASAYMKTGETQKARSLLEEILITIDRLHLYEEGLQVSQILSDIYEKTGNFAAALQMQKKYQTYYNASIGLKQQLKFKEIETKYHAIELRNQLLSQKFQLLKQKSALEENDWNMKKNKLIIVILLLLLFISIFTYFYYSRTLRTKKERELQEQKIQSAKEKLRISRDLHDNLGAELTLIKSKIDQRIFLSEDQEEVKNMTELSSYSQHAMDELRKTIWVTKSEEIKLSELELKIEKFVQRFSFDYRIKSSYTDRRISSLTGLNLYRVVQEVIQNATKHSNGTELVIAIQDIIKEKTRISIQDNGTGFHVQDNASGNGLEYMTSRIAEINGEITIDSNENGTQICITF